MITPQNPKPDNNSPTRRTNASAGIQQHHRRSIDQLTLAAFTPESILAFLEFDWLIWLFPLFL